MDVELLSSDQPFSGFLRISRHSFRYRKQDGHWSNSLTREVCKRAPAVAVLPYHPESDSVMLLEQFRLPAWLAGMDGWQIEVVAGIIEDQQNEEQTALRESREEAGLEISALWSINRVLPSPGGCDEVISFILAASTHRARTDFTVWRKRTRISGPSWCPSKRPIKCSREVR
ncbi:NUDIX domain-containing protein [Fodinicurvata halophila]|uniref:NUDIX domain-containing protein n=1 Tax=Fodinicurvata halophila TaxID=1419723 RepID=UPI0036393EA5